MWGTGRYLEEEVQLPTSLGFMVVMYVEEVPEPNLAEIPPPIGYMVVMYIGELSEQHLTEISL